MIIDQEKMSVFPRPNLASSLFCDYSGDLCLQTWTRMVAAGHLWPAGKSGCLIYVRVAFRRDVLIGLVWCAFALGF